MQTTSLNCGPTSVSILTGDPIPHPRYLPVDNKYGTTTFQLASYLSKTYTRNTTIISYFNPAFTTSAEQRKLTEESLYDRFLSYAKPKTADERLSYRYALNYLKYTPNTRLEISIPTQSYIDSYLKKGFHALCLVTSNHFYHGEYNPHEEPFNFHFVVIGKHPSNPETEYKLYDPLSPKASSIRKDVLMYSMNLTVSPTDCGTGATIFFK